MAAAVVWVEDAKGVASLLQVVAIVVGGVWAYYRFVRRREDKPRASIEATAVILEGPEELAIRLDVCFKNTGSAYIHFEEDKTASEGEPPLRGLIQVWGTEGLTGGTNPYWGDDELIVADVFTRQRGCESGETLSEQILLPVPVAGESKQGPWRALRIDVQVFSPDRLGEEGRPKPWIATTILPDGLMTRSASSTGSSGNEGSSDDMVSGA
jgi:hypothetical protein